MIQKIYILLTILVFSSCYDDFDNSLTIVEEEVPTTTMETGITGKILGVNNQSIEIVELVKDGQTLATGQINFYSYLNNAQKRGDWLELYASERLIGAANPFLIENDINYLEIAAFSNLNTFVYNNSDAAKLNIAADIELDLGINAFLDSDGNTLSNNIQIDYSLSSNAKEVAQLGNIAYVDGEAVLMHNSSLLFINGSTRNIDYINDIDQTKLTFGSSYEGKSLFYLNRFGQFTLLYDDLVSGDVVPVADLGVFIIGEYKKGVYTEGTVVKESNRVSYMPFDSDNRTYYSTAKGRWANFLPANENVTLQILTPCLDILESKSLQIEETEKQFELDIKEGDDLIYNIKTKVINCAGEVEEIQAINVTSDDNSFIYVFNDSEIDSWIPICKDEFDISGSDRRLLDNGPQFSWSIDISDDLTIISNCTEFENGFGYVNINGEERVYDAFNVDTGNETTSLKSSTDNLRLYFDGLSERDYEEEEVRIFINDPGFGASGYAISCENSPLGCGIEDFVVTHFEDTNDGWLRVSFSGVLWAQTIDPPVAGNYPISGVILSKIN